MDRTSVQLFSDEYMQNPYVKKRLKIFYNKIDTNIVKNDILVNTEGTPEGWHLHTNHLEYPHLPYNTEAEILEFYE